MHDEMRHPELRSHSHGGCVRHENADTIADGSPEPDVLLRGDTLFLYGRYLNDVRTGREDRGPGGGVPIKQTRVLISFEHLPSHLIKAR